MGLSSRLTLTNTLQTLVSATADNDKAPLRGVHLECPGGDDAAPSSNAATFVVTFVDNKTQQITLSPGQFRDLIAIKSDYKGITLVQAKNAVDDNEAIGVCDTTIR